MVELTPRGRSRLEASRPSVLAACEQVLAPLTGAERRALRDLLAKLLPAAGAALPGPKQR